MPYRLVRDLTYLYMIYIKYKTTRERDRLYQRWKGRLPAPRKKVRPTSARGALLPSRGSDVELYTRHLIGCWNVCTARSGGSGRRWLGGSVHVNWTSVCWSGPARRALAVSVYFSRNNPTTTERPDNRRSVENFYYTGKLRGCLIPAKFCAVPATMFAIKY